MTIHPEPKTDSTAQFLHRCHKEILKDCSLEEIIAELERRKRVSRTVYIAGYGLHLMPDDLIVVDISEAKKGERNSDNL